MLPFLYMGDKAMAAVLVGLTSLGEKAIEVIVKYLADNDIECPDNLFHSPVDCAFVDANILENSELVLIHDGVDACRALSMDGAFEQNGGDYSLYEGLVDLLGEHGVYLEQINRWSSAVYKD